MYILCEWCGEKSNLYAIDLLTRAAIFDRLFQVLIYGDAVHPGTQISTLSRFKCLLCQAHLFDTGQRSGDALITRDFSSNEKKAKRCSAWPPLV